MATAALLLIACQPQVLAAQDMQGTMLNSGAPACAQSLLAGQKLLVEEATSPLFFAGRTLQLTDFTGTFGYSAETAYVLVISGRAGTGTNQAGAGEVLEEFVAAPQIGPHLQ